MRLNRFLARSGVASRRKCDEIIRDGRVSVNGTTVSEPWIAIIENKDRVTVDGRSVFLPVNHKVIILNKPRGILTTAHDTHDRPTVYGLLGRIPPGLIHVGRLDRDSEGLLLFTTDGQLAHRLTHPRWHVKKIYRVEISGHVDKSVVLRLSRGIHLEDGPVRPVAVRILKQRTEGQAVLDISVHEGRKRLVRRMCHAVGLDVRKLTRIQFGHLRLTGLPTGSWRELSPDEVKKLKIQVDLL